MKVKCQVAFMEGEIECKEPLDKYMIIPMRDDRSVREDGKSIVTFITDTFAVFELVKRDKLDVQEDEHFYKFKMMQKDMTVQDIQEVCGISQTEARKIFEFRKK